MYTGKLSQNLVAFAGERRTLVSEYAKEKEGVTLEQLWHTVKEKGDLAKTRSVALCCELSKYILIA